MKANWKLKLTNKIVVTLLCIIVLLTVTNTVVVSADESSDWYDTITPL